MFVKNFDLKQNTVLHFAINMSLITVTGLYGLATWSIWLYNMVYMVVQYGLYGYAILSIWSCNVVYMVVQYGL
jgi:hypothetical protein